MKRDFDSIMENLKITIADYKYYTDFDKVFKNVEKYEKELSILNGLVGSKNIEKEFVNILENFPKVVKVIPMLLATRKKQIPVIDGIEIDYDFSAKNMKSSDYIKFMKETGLFFLLENSVIKSLHDYIIGVEVGLDSNSRKNRTGTTMEDIVYSFLAKIPNVIVHRQMKKVEIEKEYRIDLNKLILPEENKKEAEKKFDFVVKTENKLYLIETNFYGSQGSKLNETARSFKSLARDIKNIDNVEFVWITDGIGWNSAKNNLEETYDEMQYFYTLKDLEDNKLYDLFTREM